MDKSEIEALLARLDVWLLIFGVIVVVGVAGESFFGIRHWWNSRKLQAIQNSENEAQRAEIGELRQKNLQLEKELSPRVLAIHVLPNGESNIDELKKFAGTRVVLGCIHDAEALHAAGSIKWLLEKAGWNVVVTIPVDPFSPSPKMPDGVTLIQASEGDAVRNAQLLQVLLSALTEQGWKEIRPGQDTVPDWKELKIMVGFKPPAYELLK
jgi:hypothetical protein